MGSADEHVYMIHAEDADAGRRGRRRRPTSEKVQIVRLTLEPGASVSEVARAHGVNANQVFKWRRLFDRGQLVDGASRTTALLPVTISAEVGVAPEPTEEADAPQVPSGGAIHIELVGKANISVESGADATLLRCVLETLRK
jgi:transposase